MKYSAYKLVLLCSCFFFIVSFIFWSCSKQHTQSDGLQTTANIYGNDSSADSIASVILRKNQIQKILTTETPVLIINYNEPALANAQQVFITSAYARNYYKNKQSEKLLNEIFTVRKALPSDIQNKNCATCYRVEMYNYALNSTIAAIVDLSTNSITDTMFLANSAPDLPEHLKKIAVDIAIHSPLVKNELKDAPEIKDAQMAYTKTALNNSTCERSMHLCVAPTFVQNNKALWSIVDLTDLHLVGTRWTNVGNAGPVRITEKKIQNEKISTCYCEQENTLERSGWKMTYNITSSDGLRIANLTFNNHKICKSAKLVDWHVSYSNSDGFGYSDGIGCPVFSLSAVTAWDAPQIIDLKENNTNIGFVLEQVYKSDGWPAPCNYNYVQRYEFYNDGRFRTSAASIGRGCGNDGTYRPVLRIAFEGNNTFAEYNGTSYIPWNTEKWSLQKDNTRYTPEGYGYKIQGAINYFIEPSYGQFNDNGRGDNAYVYVSQFKTNEGENDLVTIGPCCNVDYKQGPEKFIEPQAENIEKKELVLWYVPQMKNDNTKGKEYCWAEAKITNGKYETISYPCFAGPMFVPIK